MHIAAELLWQPPVQYFSFFCIGAACDSASGQKAAAHRRQVTALLQNLSLICHPEVPQVSCVDYLCFPSLLPAKVFHSPPSRFISIHLTLRIQRRRPGMTSPMIEYTGHMDDSFPGKSQSAYCPKYQIVILGTVKFFPKSQLFHQLRFHNKKMTNIIIAQKQIQIKLHLSVRFIEQGHFSVSLILIRIKYPGKSPALLSFPLNGLHHSIEGVRLQNIIMIQQTDITPFRPLQRLICIF